MIELVFIVCLKTNPTACEERVISFLSERSGAGACMVRAQPELAAWAAAHPAFTVENWKCQDSTSRKIDI